MTFMMLELLYIDNVDKKEEIMAEGKANKISPQSCEKVGMETLKDEVVDVDAVFPAIMTEEPLVLLLYKEMKRSHRWISIYFTYNKNFPRALRLLSLSSVYSLLQLSFVQLGQSLQICLSC